MKQVLPHLRGSNLSNDLRRKHKIRVCASLCQRGILTLLITNENVEYVWQVLPFVGGIITNL